MKIYTRFGDQGDTQLLGGQTTRKNDTRVALCGTLDEMNAVIGLVASHEVSQQLAAQITSIQSDLFTLGATVAAVGSDSKMDLPKIGPAETERLESEIDQMETHLKPLTNFLLPGGSQAAATMHLGRAVCRRAERILVDLTNEFTDFESSDVLRFLNRLSDWCFVAARFINHNAGVDEPIWSS